MGLQYDEFLKTVQYTRADDGSIVLGLDVQADGLHPTEDLIRQIEEFELCKHDPVLLRLFIERYDGEWHEAPPIPPYTQQDHA